MRIAVVSMVMALVVGLAWAQDQGFTGERHKANVGKIIWAKQRITKDAQDQIPLASEFEAGDPIYGRVYLPKSLVRLGAEENGGTCENAGSNYRVKVVIDGESKGVINEQWFESSSWTTVQVTLSLIPGDEGDRQNLGVPAKWMDMVKALPDGDHVVMIEFWGGPTKCETKVAEGGFTLKKSGSVKAALGSLPEARMSDSGLEEQMIQAVKGQGWTNEYPVKVVIIEPEWRIIRDVFNTIVRREINTHVVLKKNVDGSCRANDISFTQQYLGDGKYGKTEFYGLGLRSYPVACP
ncbi:MAG: hypothetical protein MUE60_09025 [Candidatus Eisenbacteria bacterium]|jgi:hypothetical protein|nr:hypothetical protein [Candidatus Eisenbacteria bacterium]